MDDTLIDTQNCITKPKLKRALELVIKKGFVLKKSFDEEIKTLFALDEKSQNAKEALQHFFGKSQKNHPFLQMAKEYVYFSQVENQIINANPYVLDTLEKMTQKHTLALVTMGDRNRQLCKLKKAGIDIGLFSKIIITNVEKKHAYLELINAFSYKAEDVLVCGDKYSIDLSPAKELGLKTVQVMWGRGKSQKQHFEKTHFLIDCFKSLIEIVGSYEDKK